jgi:hypothetical protein
LLLSHLFKTNIGVPDAEIQPEIDHAPSDHR